MKKKKGGHPTAPLCGHVYYSDYTSAAPYSLSDIEEHRNGLPEETLEDSLRVAEAQVVRTLARGPADTQLHSAISMDGSSSSKHTGKFGVSDVLGPILALPSTRHGSAMKSRLVCQAIPAPLSIESLQLTPATPTSWFYQSRKLQGHSQRHLEPLLPHMARQSFVLLYAPNVLDAALLHQLRTMEESIRARWAKHIRVKRITLEAAILVSEPIAVFLSLRAQKALASVPDPAVNDGRGCHKASCASLHHCDIMLPNGSACMGRHN
eukprot:6490661-Amphidinium_carterae.1